MLLHKGLFSWFCSKGGECRTANFKGGQVQIQGEEQLHIKYRETQLSKGRGDKSILEHTICISWLLPTLHIVHVRKFPFIDFMQADSKKEEKGKKDDKTKKGMLSLHLHVCAHCVVGNFRGRKFSLFHGLRAICKVFFMHARREEGLARQTRVHHTQTMRLV